MIALPPLKFMNVEQNVSFIHVLIRTLDNNFTHSENKMKNTYRNIINMKIENFSL